MILDIWAKKHNVSQHALNELKHALQITNTDTQSNEIPLSEGAVQNQIRLEASEKNIRLWRNNVGAFNANHPPSPGTRWGLCNDSKQMNALVKSSDLIGIRPVLITPAHVGSTIGQFVAREVKKSAWTFKNDAHEEAQLNFLQIVLSLGGDACFANSRGSL